MDEPPESLGLGGDGDDVDAIKTVEQRFGVTLDYGDADKWITVGDVFAALQRELPDEQAKDEQTWQAFTAAISEETGVDATKITQSTLLLGKGRPIGWRAGLVIIALTVIGVAMTKLL